MPDIKHQMAVRHERDIAELFAPFGGHVSKASGATDSAKNDGRTDHFGRWAFSWDCKATQGQSIAVSRALLNKLRKDATGDSPVLPLRFYANDQLDISWDLVAFQLEDVRAMFEALAELEELQAQVSGARLVRLSDEWTDEQVAEFHQRFDELMANGGQPAVKADPDAVPVATDPDRLTAALTAAQDRESELEEKLAKAREERDDALKSQAPSPSSRLAGELTEANRERATLREQLRAATDLVQQHTATIRQYEQAAPAPVTEDQAPVDIPRTDHRSASGIGSQGWMIVQQFRLPGGQVHNIGTWWDAKGHSHPTVVNGIRIEPVGPHAERLVVNDRVVRAGDLYIGGKLRLRVGA
jgi:hypothetical protein